jgi:hypothetical protein
MENIISLQDSDSEHFDAKGAVGILISLLGARVGTRNKT